MKYQCRILLSIMITAVAPVCASAAAGPCSGLLTLEAVSLTKKETDVIRGYTGGNYLFINGLLRGQSLKKIARDKHLYETSEPEVRLDILRLKRALGKVRPQEATLYRFLELGLDHQVDWVEKELLSFLKKHPSGRVVSDAAFVSATSNARTPVVYVKLRELE